MLNKLTLRQKEILKLLAQGKTPVEIAALLHISISTVRRHLSDIYNRLGVSSQSQAISLYLSTLEKQDIEEKKDLSALSSREKVVYSLHRQGFSSKEIGATLSISAATLREYLRRARKKLELA